MRKKTNLEQRMSCVADLIADSPRKLRGQWCEQSGGKPIWLEIGCGKGRFAVGTATRNPDVFVVAVEMEPSALVMAAESALAAGVNNLLFMNMDAALLESCFDSCELSRIFLNFSDPWPRNGFRRLTHERFLAIYRRLLAEDGDLLMKTDNAKLFEWSVEQFTSVGWRLDGVTRDLHVGTPTTAGDYHPVGGVVTEYEQRFSAQGVCINRLAAFPPSGERTLTVELCDVTSPPQIAELCQLASRLWREHYTRMLGKAQVAYMVEKFQSEAAVAAQIDDGYIYRLLRIGGEAAGYIAAKRENDHRLFVSKLYIGKQYRGRGFARLMLDACVNDCGATALYLTCNRHNADTLAAYERLGFAVTGEQVADIGGGFVMDDFVLEKMLQ